MSFPESMKAGRFLYQTDLNYAGKLIAATKRSIENANPDIWLFRLEFEIFLIVTESEKEVFVPTGGIASRDVVITKDAGTDEKLREYAKCLNINYEAKSWYRLDQPRKEDGQRWLRIQFGVPDPEDFRQPFVTIGELKTPKKSQIKISESVSFRRKEFYRTKQVCDLLKTNKGKSPSEDTLTKFLDKHEKQYGERLVIRSEGGQRAISWYLCWHLWEAEKSS